ncbi:MAG TPA: 3'-5' exonuclease [Candidatus Thermoplasmatota archaeon]|nr:3'-5' exonuclease [Candidatus Thermoplasmatota archaeon]
MRIVAFDTETTGTDPEKDRIVEITLLPIGGSARTFRVNPGVPIPEAATAVHGITDADVSEAPPFAAVAAEVQGLIADATLLGYNSRGFDTLILDRELRRAGERGIDLATVQEIDVYRMWHALEPRTLAGAALRWLGVEHAKAHDAKADVEMTLDVWRAMCKAAGLDEASSVKLTRPDNEIDRAGKFVINDEGRVVYNFGRYQGQIVAHTDPGYLQWMSNQDFPTSTKAAVQELILSKGDHPKARRWREAGHKEPA